MNKFRYLVAAALLAATTVAAVGVGADAREYFSVLSGNGQVSCQLCTINATGIGLQNFDGMYVKVTDGSGNPVANATVSWAVTFGSGVLSSNGGQTDQTLTNSAGIAVDTYLPFSQITGNTSTPFLCKAQLPRVSRAETP